MFRFGRCEVNAAKRQVVFEGEERSLEPRPFDALVYLLRNRERVVPKDELLDAVWQHKHVSQGVISRAVSLIRRAIGDDAVEGSPVRTVHGVGLRFTGEVEVTVCLSSNGSTGELTAADPIPPASRRPAKAPLLAVLPFENLTGEAGLDWVEFGLSSLTAHGLEQASRVSLVPLASLQKALAAIPGPADATKRAEAIRRLLGVDLLLHVQVRRDPQGFRLDYSHGSELASADQGSLRGADLVTLADELAGEVGRAWTPAGQGPPIAVHTMDSLSGESFARAMQAAGEQKWKQASHLLHVVLDTDPGSALIQRELFTCLATIGDESAIPLGHELLHGAETAGQPEGMAFTHHMLGRCHALRRMQDPAQRHLDEALCLSQEHGPWEWTPMAMQYRFQLAMHHGELDRVRQLMEVMRRSWADSANQCLRINWLSNLSMMSWRSGHLAQSLHVSWAARQLSAGLNLAGDHAEATVSLAVVCGELGMLSSAIEHGKEALAAGLALAEPTIIARMACSLCWMYRESRFPEGAAQIVASLDCVEYRVAASLPGLWMARGHHAAAECRHDEAASHWREAVGRARRHASHAEYVALPWLVVSLIQCGSLNEAHQLLEESLQRPDITGYPRVTAALQHGQAFSLHASGQREAALALLSKVADEAPQSHWRAMACMDAAWLQLDAGRLTAARRLVRDLGSWLEEHPLGRMLHARLLQAEGGAACEHLLAEAASVASRCLPSRS
ncbi:winged helix-turn-helix domain-containing protein [Ideonella sp. YS5]|uniref:winged helix-turn-helix domain-containing protein n=1 Tax=Ideonella sp. YS5 TaxID=3453714 RepID=UPI003EED3E33